MNIIPAIDIIEGKCVRLQQGDYTQQKVYAYSPVDMAKQFQDAGLQHLHIVDLDGAKAGRIINLKTLEAIAKATTLQIAYGGGIRTEHDINTVLGSGAAKVTIGSIAVKQPDSIPQWLAIYEHEKLVLGADCMDRRIAVSGWTESAGIDVLTFIQDNEAMGVTQVLCTDISKDGMLAGPSIALYKDICAATNINLIASGGIRSLADIDMLREIGCTGAIIGKAIYEGASHYKNLHYAKETHHTLLGYQGRQDGKGYQLHTAERRGRPRGIGTQIRCGWRR